MSLPIPVRNKLRSTPYIQGLFHIPPTAVVGSDTRNFFLPLKISQSVPRLVLSKNSIYINWKAYYEGFLNVRWPKWSKGSWKMGSLGRNWFDFLLNTLSSKLYFFVKNLRKSYVKLIFQEGLWLMSQHWWFPNCLPYLRGYLI